MPEIHLQHGSHIVPDHGISTQQIADRAVAVAGGAFGGIDGVVHVEIASGKPPERLPDVFECGVALGLVDQAGAGDRAGIHHRIEGMILGVEADRVEGIARWLDANDAFDPRRTQRIQRQREHERF